MSNEKVSDTILEQVYAANREYLGPNKVTKSGRKLASESAKTLDISELEHSEIMVFLKNNIGSKA